MALSNVIQSDTLDRYDKFDCMTQIINTIDWGEIGKKFEENKEF